MKSIKFILLSAALLLSLFTFLACDDGNGDDQPAAVEDATVKVTITDLDGTKLLDAVTIIAEADFENSVQPTVLSMLTQFKFIYDEDFNVKVKAGNAGIESINDLKDKSVEEPDPNAVVEEDEEPPLIKAFYYWTIYLNDKEVKLDATIKTNDQIKFAYERIDENDKDVK